MFKVNRQRIELYLVNTDSVQEVIEAYYFLIKSELSRGMHRATT